MDFRIDHNIIGFIALFCGIGNIPQKILVFFHILYKYENYVVRFWGIMLVPHNTVMDLNNDMRASSFTQTIL